MTDFEAKDTGKELWLKPISKRAKEICKHYKGVYMNAFLMPYHLYDGFIQSYNRYYDYPITTLITIK